MATIKCPKCGNVIAFAEVKPNYYHYHCDCGWEGYGNHLAYKFSRNNVSSSDIS